MIRALAPAIVALAMLLAACGGGDDGDGADVPSPGVSSSPSPAANACTPARTAASGTTTASISSGGLERAYIVHVPTGYDGTTKLPVVFAFHGLAMDAETFANYHEFHALADASSFMVVTPDGANSPKRWNQAGGPGDADDLAFFNDILDSLAASHCIDENRVFVAGYSNGGGMAQLIACEATDRIAAIAVVAATFISCRADVPLIAFHGIYDPIVAFEGGENPPERGGGVFPPIRRSVSEWAREVGCDGLPLISRPSPNVELSTFNRCHAGDGEVLLYTIIDGGHTWPGATLHFDVVGFTTQEIKASEVIWSFFAEHPPAQ